MVNPRREVTFGWLKRIVRWEANVEEEDTSGIWGVIRTHDGRLPGELVFLVKRASRTISRRVLSKIDEFFLDALECHSYKFCELNYNY